MSCMQGFGEVIKPRTVGFQTILRAVLNWYEYGNDMHTLFDHAFSTLCRALGCTLLKRETVHDLSVRRCMLNCVHK